MYGLGEMLGTTMVMLLTLICLLPFTLIGVIVSFNWIVQHVSITW